MKPDGDFVLEALLQHNYLPMVKRYREEVPPALTSASFTPAVAREVVSGSGRSSKIAKGYDEVDYRLTKHNGVSRLCTIPHPDPYARLALCIHEHWQNLVHISENSRSLIRPTKHDDGRLIVMDYGAWEDKAVRELGPAFGKRYMVRTDITNCFPSVYSHSIPWALAGLDEAKRNTRNHDKYYNQIDSKIQALKRGETKGIAIGPATSNIASEIILAKVDDSIGQGAEFYRWIDDYHAFFHTEDEARKFVSALERSLGEFELQLNAQKTHIVPLPTPTAEEWVVSLTGALPRGDDVSVYDAVNYLNYAISLAPQTPDGSVLKYALRSLVSQGLGHSAQAVVLKYALNLTYHQPILLPVMDSLLEAVLPGKEIMYAERLRSIACTNARARRSDGLAWSLYYLNKYGIAPDNDVTKEVLASEDCIGLLFLYLSGLTEYQQQVVDAASHIATKEPYDKDRYWLLLYELFREGRIDNPYPDEQSFEVLKSRNVCFYQTDQT